MKPLPRLSYDAAVDADGHVLEAHDLWERYLEPKYRDRAIRLRKDDQGLEYFEIDGKPSKLMARGFPGGLGLMDRRGGIVYEREPKTGYGYMDNAPLGASDPKERLERLDLENLARAILYPTVSILWIAECADEELCQAYVRAYNRWIVDFCADSDGRLVPIAQLSLGDPAAAEVELRRCADAGVKGVWAPTFTNTRRPIGHPDHQRVFAAAAERGLPFGIHPGFEPKWCAPGRYGEYTSFQHSFFLNVTAPDAVRHAFTSFFEYGVLEQLPDLKLVVLEAGAGWIGYWLDRMDAVHGSPQGFGARGRLPERPSTYFQRQCWISADPDESTLAPIIEAVGAERFFWASDFPHPDHPPDYLPNLEKLVGALPEASRAGVLGENATRVYGLEA
jgi:predicted TIM-barrel fold metal-dependent hydrolase